MLWLGEDRGYLSDWVTQGWVKLTGRRVDLAREDWLSGPTGPTRGIGDSFFEDLAARSGCNVQPSSPHAGLLASTAELAGPDFEAGQVAPSVAHFYERTGAYELDAWSAWCGVFRPFGRLLAALFSRRLQQLNVPLSPLDTSRGMTSEVLRLTDRETGAVRYTAWVRKLLGTGDLLYAGTYAPCRTPRFPGTCVKVAFPLPNGRALVVMRPESDADGSLTLVSAGKRWGDPGFYFVVEDRRGRAWARSVRSLRESIRVYPAGEEVRADHVLTLWGATFLRLHYRLRPRPLAAVDAVATP